MASYYGSSLGASASGNPGYGPGSASPFPDLGAGASGNPGDGPGSASPFADHFAQAPSDRLLAYMQSCHKGSWHLTLNNHASTRPKSYGGATVPSVKACKTFTPPGSASASDSAFPARPRRKIRPASMLAASLLPTSSWRALGRSFYGRPIGKSRSRTCSGTCQTLCHRTRLCQCMSTRSAHAWTASLPRSGSRPFHLCGKVAS